MLSQQSPASFFGATADKTGRLIAAIAVAKRDCSMRKLRAPIIFVVSQTPEGGWAVRENDGPPLYIALSKAAAQAYAETYAKCRERSVVRIHDGDGCERGGVGAGKKQ